MRRVILLLAVGWLPPSVPPSGAGLTLGSRVLDEPQNAAEGSTTPGLRLFRCTWANLAELNAAADAGHQEPSGSYGVTGPSLAMAPMHPVSSRAMATGTTVACFPRATRRRERVQSLPGAFPLMS